MRYLLIVAPLFVMVPVVFLNQSGSPKLLAIGIGLYVALQARAIPKAAAQKQAITFLGVCVLSMLFAHSKWIAFAGAPRAMYYGVVEIALVVLVYCVSTGIEEEPYDLFVFCGAILGAVAIVQAVTGHSFNSMPLQGGRASGFRFSPVMFAASLIPCALAAWNSMRKEFPFGSSAYGYGSFMLILSGMVGAEAKGALFALAVGVWVYETKGLRRWLGAALSVCVLWLYMVKSHSQNNRERLELIRLAWEAFKYRPWLGWGPDNFIIVMLANKDPRYAQILGKVHTIQASAHQDIAQVASTLGMVGLVAYGWLMRGLVKASTNKLTMAVLVAVWIQAQVNPIPVDVLVLVAVILGYGHKTKEIVFFPAWIAPTILAVIVFIVTLDINPKYLSQLH